MVHAIDLTKVSLCSQLFDAKYISNRGRLLVYFEHFLIIQFTSHSFVRYGIMCHMQNEITKFIQFTFKTRKRNHTFLLHTQNLITVGSGLLCLLVDYCVLLPRLLMWPCTHTRATVILTDGEREGEREGRRKGSKERGREGEKEGWREGGREKRKEGEGEGGRKGRSERRKEGEKEGGRKGRREGEREGGRK